MSNKHISLKKKKGTLEVKLRDSNFEVIYKNEINVNDKRQMTELVMDLKHKGVNLDMSIVESSNGWW